MDARERARRRFQAWLATHNQTDVAKELSLEQATVSRYASGGFPLHRLDDIARIMHTTPERLIGTGEEARLDNLQAADADLLHRDTLEYELVVLFRQLTSEQRAHVIGLLQTLARVNPPPGKHKRRRATT